MSEDNGKQIGELIYQAREAKGTSTRELANRIGVHHSYLARLQLGEYAHPMPNRLIDLATELDLNAGDLLALAGYAIPSVLPDVAGLLRVKYRQLTPDDIDSVAAHVEGLLRLRSETTPTRSHINRPKEV